MENDLIIYAQQRIEQINRRIVLVKKNLETYRRLSERDKTAKERFLEEKRKQMEEDGCNEHQIEIALRYASENYQEEPLRKDYDEAIVSYQKELDDLLKEKEIFIFYVNADHGEEE